MQDKRVFREVFNFFVKYRDMIGRVDREVLWSSAAEEMGRLGVILGNTEFVHALFIAAYQELERRDIANERQA